MRQYSWILGGLGFLLMLGFLFLQVGTEELPLWATGSGILGLLMVLCFILLERKTIAADLSGRKAQHDLASGGVVLLLVGTTISINVLSHQLDERWDLTSDRSFSLSPQTIAMLETIDEPVEVLAFFPGDSEEERYFRDLSANLQAHTPHLEVQLVDPVQQPSKARLHDVTDMGVILRSGDRESWVSAPYDEASFRMSLLQVQSEETYTICFSTGHGEPALDEAGTPSDFGAFVLALDELNYAAMPVELLVQGDVPEECSVFIATVTEKDWQVAELEALSRYLARGGQVLAFPYLPQEELLEVPEAYFEALPVEFNSSWARYGIWVGPLPVEEQSPDHILPSEVAPSTFTISPSGMLPHPITESLRGSIVTERTPPILPLPVDAVAIDPLLSTTPSALSLEPDEDGNWIPIEGPISIGVVVEIADPAAIADVENPEPGGRIVMLGSPAIAANSLIQIPNAWNSDLVRNAIAWLVDEDVQLASRYPTDTPQPPLLTLQDVKMVRNLVLLFIPGLALLGALGTWRKRRRL